MPPVARSEVEELDFLDSLLSELDNDVPQDISNHPSLTIPPSTPSRRRLNSSPRKTPRPKNSGGTPVLSKETVHPLAPVDLDTLFDGVEDWWDDIDSDFMTPHKASPVKAKRARYKLPAEASPGPPCSRCFVKKVQEDSMNGRPEKILDVEVSPTNALRRVVLRDDWSLAEIHPGDVINVIGHWATASQSPSTSSPLPALIVCSKHNFFIHHPDILLTATSLSNTSQCLRRPLLSTMVRSLSDITPSLVWGNMLHEVMQTCLNVARWDDKFLDRKISEVIQKNLGELLRVNIGAEQAMIEVKARAKGLRGFADKYVGQAPKPGAGLTDTRAARAEKSLLAVSQIYDIEEDIWSPTYGLKGKLDASVEAVVHTTDDGSTPFLRAAPKTQKTSSPMPFEIKTGRANAGLEHRAQTMLYTLLMGERYGTEVSSGLLYYTQSEEVVRVPAARNELRALLVARNEMAGHMMRRLRAKGSVIVSSKGNPKHDVEIEDLESFLPPTIDNNRTCGKCYALDTCMLFRKAVEGVEDHDSAIADIFHLKTGHLTESQAMFFKKWESLISLEEKDMSRFRKELWTMTAGERQEKGRCFSDMILDAMYRPSPSLKPTLREGKIHQSTYRFVKASSSPSSLLSGHMGVGDPVIVSVEPGLLALARGFIVELGPDSVVLGVDHELDEEMVVDRLRGRQANVMGPVIFRIDQDELAGGMARIRDNLAQLFYAGADARRLELVVDLATPYFLDDDDPAVYTPSALDDLNQDQRLAIRTVLRAEDYALLLGMPGTGKTTVIAAMIKELVGAGKTVLLSSYTHSAVDNILSKLDGAEFDILRLGNLDKIHPAVQKYTLAARPLAKTIESLEHQVMSPPVVATTCLSVDHPLFARRTFDYCIVDEASQITLPTCLGPLRFAKKFILVGDHFQLPPLVRNKAARKGGLEVSLFRRLCDAHPDAVVDLTYQYRMNKDIMLLSNQLVYNNRLKCGSEAVAARSLHLPNDQFLHSLHVRSSCRSLECWISRLMNESCKAVFVDTDKVPARDSRVGDLVENQVEAQIVRQVTECLLGCGIEERQIGIISLYRQQIKLLSHLLRERKGLEILTADRSQGRDKDCIIISMVRANDGGLIGELMTDWRRMNVSFTRARAKLIVVGSRETLQGAPLLKEFFELMHAQKWILTLPPDAHLMHDFGRATPKKRSASEMSADASCQSQRGDGEKPKKSRNGASMESILKGRPLLRDLVNARK